MPLAPRHVQEAFAAIRQYGLPSGNRPSTKWDVIDPRTGDRFPPKAVLRLAKERAKDGSFSGGGGWPTNDPLIALGFQVALKPHLETSDEATDILEILNSRLDETTKQRLVNARLGQGGYREALLEIWNERCPVTGCNVKEVLRASHIKSWRSSSDQERLDPANGILLSASFDALFDRYLITFTKTGSIRVNSSVEKSALRKIGLLEGRKIPITARTEEYLVSHRKAFDRISAGQSYEYD